MLGFIFAGKDNNSEIVFRNVLSTLAIALTAALQSLQCIGQIPVLLARTIMITVPSLHRHYMVATSLLHRQYLVATSSLHCHCIVTTSSLRLH